MRSWSAADASPGEMAVVEHAEQQVDRPVATNPATRKEMTIAARRRCQARPGSVSQAGLSERAAPCFYALG